MPVLVVCRPTRTTGGKKILQSRPIEFHSDQPPDDRADNTLQDHAARAGIEIGVCGGMRAQDKGGGDSENEAVLSSHHGVGRFPAIVGTLDRQTMPEKPWAGNDAVCPATPNSATLLAVGSSGASAVHDCDSG